jgi:ABC-2 type transport system ATP-binding protein
MLTGYFLPTSGTIRIKDYTIFDHLIQIKQLIGYLPESAPLYRNMLVYDYLDYVARIRGMEKQKIPARIRQLADMCGLDEIMHKNIDTLSRGLNQRVGLAHAMMADPEILVLDEPTAGLDPNQIVEIRDIIRHIGKEKTVILSTHILSEAEATCDRVVIINRGQVVADDHTQNLKQLAGQEHMIHLTLLQASLDAATEALSSLNGINSVETVESTDEHLKLRLHCQPRDHLRESIYEVIKKTDWILIELYQETQTLEAVFRKLTKEN